MWLLTFRRDTNYCHHTMKTELLTEKIKVAGHVVEECTRSSPKPTEAK